MGPSTVDMSTHTLTGHSWGAILAQVVFLDTRLPTSVSAGYFQWEVPMDGVIEQSCGCPGTRVVCSMRGAVARGVQLDVRLWDLAGGAAAELETWSLLSADCPTRWKQMWATVAVKHKLSLCSWGTLGVFPVEKNLSPDSYPRFIPDSYPDSFPSAAICSQEPLALWAVLATLCRPNPQKTQNSKRSTAGTSSRLFSQKFARRWVRKAYCDVSSATR